VSPWKVILATVIIFAAGVITGGVLVNRVKRPEGPRPLPPFARPQQELMPMPFIVRREFLDRMDRHLNLSREQYDRIAKIIQDSQERTRRIVGRVGPDIQDELRQVRRQIRTELTPDQARQFDELQQMMRRPPPPGRLPGDGPDPRRVRPPRGEPPPVDERPRTNTP
jgi:hypothetical protein